MGQIPVDDSNLLTPTDMTKVRMELFEKIGDGTYKVRYQAALTFLQIAIDAVVDGADAAYDTLAKIQALIEPLLAHSTYMDFTPQNPNPSYTRGRLFYDDLKDALSYYNAVEDITLNIGQELLIRVYNDTGDTIPNGAIVYPTGVLSDAITIDLADASKKTKSRLVGMVTHEILDGESGYVTRLGEVGDLNTSSLGAGGVVYLSATTPGAFTLAKPTDGGYVVAVGAVKIVHASQGSIVVDPQISELTVEVTDTNGFPSDQRSGTTITFTNGSLTFEIAPTSSGFHYYQTGDKYEKEAAENVVIDDTEGGHIIYFDAETLTALANPSAGQLDVIIRTKALVAYLYWDKTNQEAIFIGDERHGIGMSPETHAYLHFTRGAQYLNGLALNNILKDQSGDVNTHAQFGVDLGFIVDEDLLTSIGAVLSTAGLNIFYLNGANGDLRKTTNAGYSVLTTGTGRLAYNQWTGAVWQLTEVTNNDFVLCHVFASNDKDNPMLAIVGQAKYNTLGQARTGANNEISSLLLTLPQPEMVPVATLIFQTSDGYSNAVQGRVRSTDTGEDYVNWLTSELAQGAAPTSHANLSDLEKTATGANLGHVDNDLPLQFPELTTVERDAIGSPNAGMIIYNTTTNSYQRYINSVWLNEYQLANDLDANDRRFLGSQGDDIVSANNLLLEATYDGNTYDITGTTQVNLINADSWQDGAEVVLKFENVLVVKNGQSPSGEYKTIHTIDGKDIVTAAGMTIAFRLIDSGWYEVGRETGRLYLTQTGISANGQLSFSIPAGYGITSMTIIGSTARLKIDVGTTSGEDDVIKQLYTTIDYVHQIAPKVRYFAAEQDLYISSNNWSTATVEILIVVEKYKALKEYEAIQFAISDEDSDLETGTGVFTFRMPYPFYVIEVRASVKTAPTGARLKFDINEEGVSILDSELMIDEGEKTSVTAGIPVVAIGDNFLADDAEITVDIDQIGSTVAGAGGKITFLGFKV